MFSFQLSYYIVQHALKINLHVFITDILHNKSV